MPASDAAETEVVEYKTAWGRDDPELRRDALAFWRGTRMTPEQAEQRASELCVLGYVNGKLEAITTAVVRPVGFLAGARFAMYRVLVSPHVRRQNLSRMITAEVRRATAEWSLAHPDERVMGFGAVVQSPVLLAAPIDAATRKPYLRLSGLTAVGYTDQGDLIRLTWFDHARV